MIPGDPGSGLPFHASLLAFAKDSFSTAAQLVDTAERMRAAYQEQCEKRSVSFGEPERFFRVLERGAWNPGIDPARVEVMAQTVESFVDLPALARRVTQAVRDHPRITVLTGHDVVGARPRGEADGGGFDLEVRVDRGAGTVVGARRVLNASWISRRRLDADIAAHTGARPPADTVYRLRALLRVRLSGEQLDTPSALVAHGPFCTFTNCGDGTGLMMYEPVSNVATAKDHVPAQWWPLLDESFPPEQHDTLARTILAGVAEFIPALRGAEPLDVMASALYHGGQADIYDPTSAIHHRLGTGVKQLSPHWLSLDSGKLTWVPRYADHVVTTGMST
ncbi:hypothetical protein ACIQWR_33380 [Streptomyces sp. NPDC098789]|uniref:hypothetical protein n=1 Tax=Streptomyces sp. NPDC098789 TaxID=3366098 RepID=UPI0037FD7263